MRTIRCFECNNFEQGKEVVCSPPGWSRYEPKNLGLLGEGCGGFHEVHGCISNELGVGSVCCSVYPILNEISRKLVLGRYHAKKGRHTDYHGTLIGLLCGPTPD
jgi:hypothetical protein